MRRKDGPSVGAKTAAVESADFLTSVRDDTTEPGDHPICPSHIDEISHVETRVRVGNHGAGLRVDVTDEHGRADGAR